MHRGIAELPENELGQGFETDEFTSSYSPPKLTVGLGNIVNINAKVVNDWIGTDSTYLSLKSGEIVKVTENQVCINVNFIYYNGSVV